MIATESNNALLIDSDYLQDSNLVLYHDLRAKVGEMTTLTKSGKFRKKITFFLSLALSSTMSLKSFFSLAFDVVDHLRLAASFALRFSSLRQAL